MKSKPLLLLALLALVSNSRAVSNILVTVQNTNVVLTWPSKTNASYLIQFRSAFGTNNQWINLTNQFPAAAGTNRTSFTILGAICPPPTNSGGGGSGGPLPPPWGLTAFHGMDGQTYFLSARDEVLTMEDLLPYPWNPRFAPGKEFLSVQSTSASGTQASGQESLSDSNGCPSMGFYRVLQLPKWPNGIANAVVDGLTFSPIDFDDYFFQIANLTLLVNEQPTALGFLKQRPIGGVTNNGVDLWFNEMANGPTQFRLRGEIRLDDSIGIDSHTPTLTLTSAPITFLVSNPILFTNFEAAVVGNSTAFEAFSIQPNVDWTIDVYDVVGAYVSGASGYSASGQISWTWNLYDWEGMLRDDWEYDPLFYSEITVTPRGSLAAAAVTKPTPLKALDFPKVGTWLIAYQDYEKRATPRSQFIQSMNEMAGAIDLHNLLNVPGTAMLRYGTNESQQTRDNSWIDFRAVLSGSTVRNLYYQGHGSPTSIGGDYDRYGPTGNIAGATISLSSKAFLDADWVKNNATFNKYSGAKYFRFVFLDGCQTASGSWPDAFGIGKATNNIQFYQNPNRKPHTRPSVFMGWQTIVGGTGAGQGESWGSTSKYAAWLKDWLFNWSNNAQTFELDSSLERARVESGWISQNLMNSSLRVYGFSKLGFKQFNQRSEWNGP